MTDFRVFIKLLVIMTMVSLAAIIITTGLLYRDAVNGREEILIEVAARYRRALVAAVEFNELHMTTDHHKILSHDKDYVLKQVTKMIKRASQLAGLRGDIDVAVAILRNNEVWFLTHRIGEEYIKIPMGSDLAVPMQRALKGEEGTIRNHDYDGKHVVAAYVYIESIGLGIVAKSRTYDINMRFVQGAITAILPAVLLVLLGSYYFYRTTNHIVKRLRSDNLRFRRMAEELKAANKDLGESEQRLQCFFQAAFEGIVITEDEIFIDCNQRFADMFGYTVKEIIGMKIMELVYPDDCAMVTKHIQEEYLESYEHRSIHKNGSIIHCEVHGQTGYLKGKKVRITAIHDLAERVRRIQATKELAARKRQTSKMEAIGNFASGIAHDFNNTLTPIIGNCDLLLLKTDKDDERYENINKIYAAAETAHLLVKRIQIFTRKDPAPAEIIPLKVDACIEEAFEFLRSITPTSIHMEMNMEPNLGLVSTTDVMIRQILMNLVKNAAHAIGEDQGTIKIDVSNDIIRVERFGLVTGEYVKIDIEDNGCGMPEEVLEQALDPYYTTKDEEGTGLGLAVVQGILESHKGLIHLQSDEGLGSKVTIYLPVINGAQDSHNHCTLDEPIALGDQQRIIFVDDEEAIANMAGDVLSSLQYDATAFTDSTAALKEICLNPTAYDCLMTDLTMPHMNGIELIMEAKKVNPGLKVILSSGLGTDGRSRADLYSNLIDVYLQKPVTRREYASVLSDLFSV